jgi:3-oxoacyl-[acyl-carrier-protein] synthase II
MTGHLLGAAGAIEAIASILAMKTRYCSANNQSYSVVDENIDPSLNLTLNKAQKRDIKVANE